MFQDTERLPIILGVTGHRAYPDGDVPALQKAVRKIFARVHEVAPHSKAALLVMSALAEGADRLVARCALEAGIPVQVVLPMAQDEYEKDFQNPGSVEEFRELLDWAASGHAMLRPIVAELVLTPEEQARQVAGLLTKDELRRACYRSQGQMIVRHCQILIALWDGKASTSNAGTAAMVRFATRRNPRRPGQDVVRDPGDRAWVAHVWTRRTRDDVDVKNEPIVPGRLRWIVPDWQGLRPFDAPLDTVDDIDADCCEVIAQIDRLNGDLAMSRPRKAKPMGFGSGADWVAAWGDRVGGLTGYWQRKRDRIFRAMLWLGVGGFTFLQVYAHVFVNWPVLLAAFFAMTLAAWFLLRYHSGRSHENRHLDYRGLSEGLRVQRALNAAGVVGDVSNLYPNRREPCMEWIRAALRTLDLLGRRFAIPASGTPTLQEATDAGRGWINEQWSYFLDAIARLDRRRRYWLRLATVCFGMGLLSAMVLLVLHMTHLVHAHAPDWGVMVLLASMVMTIGATVEVYSEQMALFETAREYRRLLEIYKGYKTEFEALVASGNLPDLQALLKSLAREALAENAAWVSLHRSRHPKVRVGG